MSRVVEGCPEAAEAEVRPVDATPEMGVLKVGLMTEYCGVDTDTLVAETPPEDAPEWDLEPEAAVRGLAYGLEEEE